MADNEGIFVAEKDPIFSIFFKCLPCPCKIKAKTLSITIKCVQHNSAVLLLDYLLLSIKRTTPKMMGDEGKFVAEKDPFLKYYFGCLSCVGLPK